MLKSRIPVEEFVSIFPSASMLSGISKDGKCRAMNEFI